MIEWIKNNIGTIIVGIGLLITTSAIIFSLIKRKKQGKCVGCNCCDNKSCPSKQK